MADYNGLLNVIKQAAVDAVNAASPVSVCYGKVTNTSPIQILTDQKLLLGSLQLQFTRSVSPDTTSATSGGSGDASFASHSHGIPHGLASGDTVILLRMQGGQKYIVLDKVV